MIKFKVFAILTLVGLKEYLDYKCSKILFVVLTGRQKFKL